MALVVVYVSMVFRERAVVPIILFWNVNKKDLRNLVCDAANSVSADVVILLENCITASETLADLKSKVSPSFNCPKAGLGRSQLFSRDANLDLSAVHDGDRVSLRRLQMAKTELVLGMVHVVDKWNWDEMQQSHEVLLLAEEIRRHEKRLANTRTILIGDFNMNPFDKAMNVATGMNAMMTARCVERKSRKHQRIDYPFFYNPMWGLFGDRTEGPAGTYHHPSSSKGTFGWNMLDQVLVRPDALEWFDDVQILTSAGQTSLQTSLDRPNGKIASDHFPILLKLK